MLSEIRSNALIYLFLLRPMNLVAVEKEVHLPQDFNERLFQGTTLCSLYYYREGQWKIGAARHPNVAAVGNL
jgi:hypothetical protein